MLSTKFAFSILILFFVSTAVSDTVPHHISTSWQRAINRVIMACIAEGVSGTTPHDVAEMVKTWNIPESMKCFMDCVYKKNHFVDENGNFTDELLNYKGMTKENIQGCQDAVQTSNKDSCDRVYDFCKCIVKGIKDSNKNCWRG